MAVRTAVINKRAGGMGLISGRKAFQRPMQEGMRAPEISTVDGRSSLVGSTRFSPTPV